jgi:hypothetical protein
MSYTLGVAPAFPGMVNVALGVGVPNHIALATPGESYASARRRCGMDVRTHS